MRSEIQFSQAGAALGHGVCASDEPRYAVSEREARDSGYREAMADQLSGLLDRIDEQVKEARAIAATAADGDPTALDELTGPIEEMATAVAALRATTGVTRVAVDPDGKA
jgi:hypothetical protein